MKKTLLLFVTVFLSVLSFANHLKGGFFTYTTLGLNTTNNHMRYKVTLTLYMDCNAREGPPSNNPQVDQELYFTFFNASNRSLAANVKVGLTTNTLLNKQKDEECITGNQVGCYYKVITYVLNQVELPVNQDGYILGYQRCCRIAGVDNIVNSSTIGSTYSIQIPGNNNIVQNNSAIFAVNDTAVVCGNTPFEIPFFANDPDGDELRFEFCTAWVGGKESDPDPEQSAPPPFIPVNYSSGFSGTQPLGPDVTIDPQTGLIKGIAPRVQKSGEFVVTVCVSEYRNNELIATTRKELHIKVGNCSPVTPVLNPEYITCDGYTVSFFNKNPNDVIKSYFWDFGVDELTNDTSNQLMPSYTFPVDTGVYKIKLVVNRNQGCSDSTTALVKVYPGFEPNFGIVPCIIDPTQFIDSTYTAYGEVNSWKWDFGDLITLRDTSSLQHPTYTYPSSGLKTVRLIVTNSKGCLDTLIKPITIIGKAFAGNDTSVVVNQMLQFQASGGSLYSWSPATSLNNPNISNPVGIYDGSFESIRYKVLVSTEENCIDSAYVNVRIYKLHPQVLVPTAFTPNRDGKNDLIRPIAIGIAKIEYFSVFNRWGQRVFTTTVNGHGWDGRINGQEQGTGTYAWLVKAVDYLGRPFFAKGTLTLIR